MRNLILGAGIALFFATACNNATKSDQTSIDSTSNASTEKPLNSAATMKAWEVYMTPSEAHKMLAKSDGTWDEEISMWMNPDGPPTVSKSVAVNKMILGGRYQQSTHTGNFDGMPFEGISTVAFDNARKVYISTWIDNMGTGMMILEGTYNEASKTLTQTGKMYDPSVGKEIDVKEITKFIDEDNQLMEMFHTKNGKDVKTMAIKFTRKK
ncbi:DUF1579 domain-containing protein [Pedobacter endophyticus]|uniref:DUF1579 domain-containing protein n=1 Tax=Pedobacter endophyticus TaxID=2789740 RepID=A0A7U3Q4F0_9SPHI|nr:DUF1579 domain-containing protein [Pedobacter endophyticus]QPH38416.1 DUF1579 domain-containing protein [Pedobacter endophyticus]